MIILLGHSEATCPKPWHLKNLLGVTGLGGGLFCRVRFFEAIWDEFPMGLGVSCGVPLLKV